MKQRERTAYANYLSRQRAACMKMRREENNEGRKINKETHVPSQ